MRPVFLLIFSVFWGAWCQAASFKLGNIPLVSKPAAFRLVLDKTKSSEGASVVLEADGRTVFQGSIAAFLKQFEAVLSPQQLSMTQGHVVAEMNVKSILAWSDRLQFYQDLATMLYRRFVPSGQPRAPENLVDTVAALGTAREADLVFGSWDIEQELEEGGLRGSTGFLGRPQLPKAGGRLAANKQAPWSGVRGMASDEKANCLVMRLQPGSLKVQDSDGRDVWIPCNFFLKEDSGKEPQNVESILFLWARASGCIGHNDLKGPLGKGIRSVQYAQRRGRKVPESIALRETRKDDFLWSFAGNAETGTFNGYFGKQPVCQHPLVLLDVGFLAVKLKSKESFHGDELRLLRFRGFGPWNKPEILALSRVKTSKTPAAQPCPLRLGQGVRIFLDHTLSDGKAGVS